MPQKLKPEVSGKNRYWIEKHRYYELKHFCLQYPIWKKAYQAIDGFASRCAVTNTTSISSAYSDPTMKCAEALLAYSERIDMVERTAVATDSELWLYIMKGVTEGISYDILRVRFAIPCCRDVYYDLYRRFFWLLNRERQ